MITQGIFHIGTGVYFEGYSNPNEKFNGYECPWFSKLISETILAHIGQYEKHNTKDFPMRHSYSRTKESFVLIEGRGKRRILIEYPKEEMRIEKERMELYQLGAKNWHWTRL